VAEVPEKRVGLSGNVSQTMTLCQETVVKWFANYTTSPVKKPADNIASQQHTKTTLVYWPISLSLVSK